MYELPGNLVKNADPDPGSGARESAFLTHFRGDADAAGPWSPPSNKAVQCVYWGV